ncbi:hypothetical protein MtrunA17_Chr4g0033301 [Medicago truncatula]|uniref:40S ribosomal S10-like protein n=1 Tax=Medicago truncatula TaxID=3880 RepID=A0A072ULN1_MEDTR|nr:hypothetical protein MTR_4g066510 [Medicago truncatula]RHN61129.1 hypothetical protein MtrunA17_Chr4g0033301 [Medicago truncatula]
MDPHLFKAHVSTVEIVICSRCLSVFFIECFNGGNHHLFKVRVDITLKDMNDQLNEINQGLNLGDTRRVEDLQYACPGYLKGQKIMLTDDDYVRSMFSSYYRERMFPVIELEATLLRSPKDILNNLIRP